MDSTSEVIISGKNYILVRGPFCFQVFHRETNSQVFGSYDLETAKKTFHRYEHSL